MSDKGDVEKPKAEEAKEAGEEEKASGENSSTLKSTVLPFIATLVIIGLSQLFAFLGNGDEDPLIGGGISILQSTAALAVLVQIVVFIPCYIYQTEKYYDLTGAITYASCILYSFLSGRTVIQSDRAIMVTVLVLLWCTRLGGFLFYRVLKVGKDERFDSIKPNFMLFLMTWCLQGLWVFLTAYPAFIINADQTASINFESYNFIASDYIGLTIWIVGFVIEVTADFQKQFWRGFKNKKHKFIDYGLWRYSRHPNYFGEITLWIGMFIISIEVLEDEQYAAVISPIFVFTLIYFISGVLMLERRSDEKFGDDPEYWEYKRNTSELILLPYGWGGNKSAGPKTTE